MNEQYQKDLQEFRDELTRIRVESFDYMLELSGMDQTQLTYSGMRGKTAPEAVFHALLKGQEQIRKASRKFLSKYPDEK